VARPDAFRPGLATPLNNLAVDLADLGRREEARATSHEAVTIHRVLAARWPDAYRHKLEPSCTRCTGTCASTWTSAPAQLQAPLSHQK